MYKPFASLSPGLLARKGGARPAMRPQFSPLGSATRSDPHEDLGWNDLGETDAAPAAADERNDAEVVAFDPAAPRVRLGGAPAVLRQQGSLSDRLAAANRQPERTRRSALADGRRAAFTLRVDAERHLKLRLACTVERRSAQRLVTEALDRLLDEISDLDELAARIKRS